MKKINQFIYSNNPGIRLLRHSLFWIVDIFNWITVAVLNRGVEHEYVYIFLCSLPVTIVATYFILYYLIPRFSDNLGKLFVGLFFTLATLGCVQRLYKTLILMPIFFSAPAELAVALQPSRVIGEIFSWLAVICLAMAIKFIKGRAELQIINDRLRDEKKIVELNFLKTQMHPHFLFNTLNTLYSETMRHSAKAEQIVLHLSNLLRFILEECSKPLIRLKDEIKVIDDYIALEKLRHGSRLDVIFTHSEVDEERRISPLLLLPFVENSFKHTLPHIRGKVTIAIVLQLQQEMLRLDIENDHFKGVEGGGYQRGMGITNITRQLELLYGKNYNLSIEEVSNKFKVSLLIPVMK